MESSSRSRVDIYRMKSPLRLSHHFVAEIFFSVHGEDDRGRKLSKPGPAGLRFFRISKPVVVPSVSLLNLDVADI